MTCSKKLQKPHKISISYCIQSKTLLLTGSSTYRGADKSLAQPGRKQAWNHVRDTQDFNNIEMQAVIKAKEIMLF
jgi:hypothetical protein